MMVGRTYFTRQATTILKFARSTANPELAAMLVEKVADLKSQFDASPAPDRSPRAPDVEPPAPSPSK
jgi:phospholipase C